MIAVAPTTFEEWRALARDLLVADALPGSVDWTGSSGVLLSETIPVTAGERHFAVPKEFLDRARVVARHRDDSRWAVLYRLLHRLAHGEKHLLRISVDDDVHEFEGMEKSVRRDMHKMKAFVRFRRVPDTEPEHFVAWYRPDHHIVEAIAPWFRDRFASMRWSILTPTRSAHWDLEKLTFSPGVSHSDAVQEDALEDLWRDYYASIFNPARVKVKAMKAEMPVRHWATLPEARMIPDVLASAEGRVAHMNKAQKASAAPWIPASHNLSELRAAAPDCRGCELYAHATQVVFGEGPPDANVVMVGEQPGDEEDQRGQPFVGPSGRLLSKAMHEAGLDREKIYVTNAVKHFKFLERGKRRIHAKPSGIEISACRPWLEAELTSIEPELVVCLGATAAQSLMGRDFRITAERGKFFPHRWAKELVATVHPSAILRMPDRFDDEYELFVQDLSTIAKRVKQIEAAAGR